MPVEALDYFTGLMNDRARELGALHALCQSDGYHDPDHYTTFRPGPDPWEALKKDLLGRRPGQGSSSNCMA